MEFSLFDDRDDGEYYGVGFVEISRIFGTIKDAFFFGSELLGRVYRINTYKLYLLQSLHCTTLLKSSANILSSLSLFIAH